MNRPGRATATPLISSFFPMALICGAAWFLGGIRNLIAMACTLVICWLSGAGPVMIWLPRVRSSRMFHPLVWISGYLIITALLVAAGAAGLTGWLRVGPVAAWAAAGGYLAFRSKSEPGQNQNRRIRAGWSSPAVSIIITLAVLFVFSRVGVETALGKAYRAYFNGDFLKHVALIHEFSKPGFPPGNPYFSGETLHYYWFIYPMVNMMADFPGAAPGAEHAFLAFTCAVNILFIFVISAMLPTNYKAPVIPLLILLLGCFAVSYEGVILAARIISEGKSLPAELGHYNIDGYARWIWGHPQIDGIHRSFLYTPQHLAALIMVLAGIRLSRFRNLNRYAVMEGVVTGAAVGVSAFIGLIGVAAMVLRLTIRKAGGMFAGGIPLVLWAITLWRVEMLSPGGEKPVLELPSEPGIVILILAVNLGFLFLLGIPGLIIGLKSQERFAGSFTGLAFVSLFAFGFVRLQDNPSDVGLKAALVLIPALLAGTAFMIRNHPRTGTILMILLAFPALPTSLLDLWSTAQLDTPRYISFIPQPDRDGCRYLKTSTPWNWVVQSDPRRETRGYFSLVPTFGERRTALGDPMHGRIFQIPKPEYDRRQTAVRELFESRSARDIIRIASDVGIDALYIGSPERSAHPALDECMRHLPEYYSSGDVRIYAAKPALEAAMIAADNLKLSSNETRWTRNLLVLPRGTNPDIASFPGFDYRISLNPGQTLSIPNPGEPAVYAIPRPIDQGLSPDFDLQPGFDQWSSTGRLIRDISGRPAVMAGNGDPGLIFKKEHVMLPPGSYRMTINFSASGTSSSPTRFTLFNLPDRRPLCAGSLPDCTTGRTGEFESFFCLEKWHSGGLEITYGGEGGFELRGVLLEIIPEFREWLPIQVSSPRTAS